MPDTRPIGGPSQRAGGSSGPDRRSDAGAHLDMIGTFNYPTYLLAHAVREHELMTTERAVHLLTGAPARLYGLVDRGTITAGAAADVVIFDEDAIDTAPLTTRFDLPGGDLACTRRGLASPTLW